MKTILIILFATIFGGFAFCQSNTSTVSQTGTSNYGNVSQAGVGHQATMTQFGTNYSTVSQSGGDNNSATVLQGTVSAPVTNFHQPAYSGDWHQGAYITQLGGNNTAAITMTKSGNYGSVYQEGNSNSGVQSINTSSSAKSGSHSGVVISQFGDMNSASQTTVSSFGCYGIQDLTAVQTGSDNVADQYSIGGMATQMNVEQNGSNNNNPAVSGNAFDVSSTGIASPLSLPWAHKPSGDFTQYSYQRYGSTHMYVEGDNNNTAQYQEYTVWSVSGRNVASMDLYGSSNNAVQGQLGEYNESYLNIAGSGNVVTTSQFGDNNFAQIDLLNASNDNVAAIQQTGDGHNATISQDGVSNFAKVIQQ